MSLKLQERVQELRRLMYSLECGDDYLFSNINGQLPLYVSWEKELKIIEKQIEKDTRYKILRKKGDR